MQCLILMSRTHFEGQMSPLNSSQPYNQIQSEFFGFRSWSLNPRKKERKKEKKQIDSSSTAYKHGQIISPTNIRYLKIKSSSASKQQFREVNNQRTNESSPRWRNQERVSEPVTQLLLPSRIEARERAPGAMVSDGWGRRAARDPPMVESRKPAGNQSMDTKRNPFLTVPSPYNITQTADLYCEIQRLYEGQNCPAKGLGFYAAMLHLYRNILQEWVALFLDKPLWSQILYCRYIL